MIPNTPAQQRDWYINQFENAEKDRLYGYGHRPSYAAVGAHWAPACGCQDTACTRAEDDSRRLYLSPLEARDAAERTLIDNEHGDNA